MKKKIQLLWGYRWIFRSLFKTIYLNFKCLPFRQALFLPIILYKPRLLTLSGKINIDAVKIRSGMIQLGRNEVSFYPNSGITIENEGTIVFKGNAKIASGSCLSVKKNAVLTIGDNFHATAELKVACYCSTTIGDNVLVGWETKIFDTDFHQLTSVDKYKILQAFGPIVIGNNVWIANDCLVMKNTNIPDFCVVGARSILRKKYYVPQYSLIAGAPAKFIREGCFLDRNNMQIAYQKTDCKE